MEVTVTWWKNRYITKKGNVCWVLLFLLAAMHSSGLYSSALAQQQSGVPGQFVQADAPTFLGVVEQESSITSTIISVDLQEKPLLQALRQVSSELDLNISYSKEVLPLDKKVSLHLKNVTANKAIYAMLEGTGLRYAISGNKQLIIFKEETPELTLSLVQPEDISGTVTDAQSGETLPGVNILVKGTSTGASTDSDGNFELTVESLQDTLVVSFVGYQTQEVPIQGRTELDISLQPQAITGEEMVVVGYGTIRKSDLTGSVGTVEAEEITKTGSMQLSEALQGEISGVQVHTGSGEPGREPKVRIRGINSINAGIDPLYVVDGITGVDPTLIDPNTVESVQVLKDASATAIYGARGSNGVILITTKRGTLNQTEITFKSNVSSSHMYRWLDLLNSDEYMKMYNDAFNNAAKYDPDGYASGRYQKADPQNLPEIFDENGNPRYDTDWQREVYSPTWSNNQSLSLQGGNENTTYSMSLGHTFTDGIMAGNNYRRQNAKVTVDTEVMPWLYFGGLLTVAKVKDVDPGTALSMTRGTGEMLPMVPVKLPDGSWGDNGLFPATEERKSPIEEAHDQKTITKIGNIQGDIYSRVQLAPSLEFKTSFSFREGYNNNNYYESRRLSGSDNGNASIGKNTNSYWQNENQFNWDQTIGQYHNFKALAGFSWLREQNEGLNVSGNGFVDDYFQWRNITAADVITKSDISDSNVENTMNSYFVRLNYNFKEKYLLTLTGRYDGSSVFGEDNKYAFFPSIGIGWRISDESFMSSMETVSNLKLRGSIGSAGNQRIGAYSSQKVVGTQNILYGNGIQTGLTQTSFGNPELKWETTTQYDIGIELGLFDSKIQFEADVYYKKTKDLLFNRPVPRATGFSNVLQNIGNLENKGLELALTTRNINNNSFQWTTNINWSANRSKVLKLGTENEDIFPGPWFLGETSLIRVGEPIGLFYGRERLGTWDTDEAAEAAEFGLLPGDLKFADLNNDNTYNDADSKIIGNGYPLWEANISNSFRYQNFDLSFTVRIVYGADILNGTRHSSEDYQTLNNGYATLLDAWMPDNQDTDIAQVRAWGTPFQSRVDTHWLEDGSFIRGQNIRLGYSLPQSLIQRTPIRNLNIYMSAQNFFLITPYSGYDPEARTQPGAFSGNQLTQNFHFHQYPKPRTVRLGITLSL